MKNNVLQNKKVLVTGGAGYIGSHVVRQLGALGENVLTLDNLSTGFREAVTAGELVVGDTGDSALLEKIFSAHEIDTVMHFAAHTIVPESVSDPLKYYRNNTASSRTLFEAAHAHGVRNIVFSSTAAVYGIPEGGKAAEDSPTAPINPYGTSKLMTEWMLRDLAAAHRTSPQRSMKIPQRVFCRARDLRIPFPTAANVRREIVVSAQWKNLKKF